MTDPKPSRRRHPPSTREAILAAARAMLAENGPAGGTVSTVARRAGVNRGTAYQHFASREKLIAAVLARTFSASKTTIHADMPGKLDVGVSVQMDHLVRYLVDHPELVRLAMFSILGGV